MNVTPPAMSDDLGGLDAHAKVICSGSEAICALSNYIITTSLGGLTGVKGSIPILMVAVGSRISDRCWVSIILLSVLLLLEVLADCIPAIASLQDGMMLLCKPALSAALALSPSYGHIYGISSGAGWLAAISAGLLAVLVALMKAAWTLACDSGAAGLCSQVRSAAESVIISLLSLLVFMVGLLAAAIILVMIIFAVVRFVAQRLCKKEEETSSSDSDSSESDMSLGAVGENRPSAV